jgi:hypothetical protein
VLGECGYVYNWLYHSNDLGTEGVSKPKKGKKKAVTLPTEEASQPSPKRVRTAQKESPESKLAETQALCVRLCKSLPYEKHDFVVYLDNLFTNQPLLKALREYGIGAYGTVRKNAKGVPLRLLKLKERKSELQWDSTQNEVIEGVNCFLWQDNSALLS